MLSSPLGVMGRVAAVVVSTLGLATAAPMFGPEPAFERPVVQVISLGPDTVWFCGSRRTPSYFYVRATREWRNATAANKAPCADGSTIRADGLTTTHPARGLWISAVKAPTDSEGQSHGRSYLTVVDSTNRRTVDLKPAFDTPLIKKLLEPYEVGMDTVSTGITAVVANDSLIWIGLMGGFAEGMGELGGIYRVDRRTGSYELMIDSVLGEHTITGAASVGPWVWFATENPAEYGPYGDAGLMRLDARNRQWKFYDDSSSPLPDALIRTMESDGRILALATGRGLAIIDLRATGAPSAAPSANGDESIARWDVRYFVAGFSGDSMVFNLGSKAEASLKVEAAATIAQRFARVGHERPLYEAAARLPEERLRQGAYDDVERAAEVLADASLVPALIPVLTTRGDGQLFASFVLGSLGPRAPRVAVDAMRAAFLAMDTVKTDQVGWNRSRMGRVLRSMGDSTPVLWARALLDTAVRRKTLPASAATRVRGTDIGAAAEILANAHDRVGLTLIMGVLPVNGEEEQRLIIHALAEYDDPLAWSTLIAFGRRKQLPAIHTYSALQPSALKNPTVAARLRDFIREGLADSAGDGQFRALGAVEHLRLIDFAPTLVGLLEPGRIKDKYVAEGLITSLISMSGRTDSPVYPDSLPPKAVFDWWQRWLTEQKGNLVAAPEELGSKAVSDWYDRSRRARGR